MTTQYDNKLCSPVLLGLNVVLYSICVGLFIGYFYCTEGKVGYFLPVLIGLGLFLVVGLFLSGSRKTAGRNWSLFVSFLLLIVNISIGLVFFHYFSIQIVKLDFDHDAFRSVVGDLPNLYIVRSTKGSSLVAIETVDRLLVEFDIRRWSSPEGYEYQRTRLIENYIDPVQTREEIELLYRKVVKEFSERVDLICQTGGFYPMSRGDKAMLMRNFTTWEKLIESVGQLSNQKMRTYYRGRHW